MKWLATLTQPAGGRERVKVKLFLCVYFMYFQGGSPDPVVLCTPRLYRICCVPHLLLSPVSDETQTVFCPKSLSGSFENSDVSHDSFLRTRSSC